MAIEKAKNEYEIFRVKQDKEYISKALYYATEVENKGIKQIDLMNNPASVLYQLLSQSGSVFYCSKQKAQKDGKYVADNRDLDQINFNLPMGSIFGSNWSIKDINGEIIFENVITIASYGKEICTEKDAVTKKTIIETVLKIFRHQFIQTAFAYSLLEKHK